MTSSVSNFLTGPAYIRQRSLSVTASLPNLKQRSNSIGHEIENELKLFNNDLKAYLKPTIEYLKQHVVPLSAIQAGLKDECSLLFHQHVFKQQWQLASYSNFEEDIKKPICKLCVTKTDIFTKPINERLIILKMAIANYKTQSKTHQWADSILSSVEELLEPSLPNTPFLPNRLAISAPGSSLSNIDTLQNSSNFERIQKFLKRPLPSKEFSNEDLIWYAFGNDIDTCAKLKAEFEKLNTEYYLEAPIKELHQNLIRAVQALKLVEIPWKEEKDPKYPISKISLEEIQRCFCSETVNVNTITVNGKLFFDHKEVNKFFENNKPTLNNFNKKQLFFYTKLLSQIYPDRQPDQIEIDVCFFLTLLSINEELQKKSVPNLDPCFNLLRAATMSAWTHTHAICDNELKGIFSYFKFHPLESVDCNLQFTNAKEFTAIRYITYGLYLEKDDTYESGKLKHHDRIILPLQWKLRYSKGKWSGFLSNDKRPGKEIHFLNAKIEEIWIVLDTFVEVAQKYMQLPKANLKNGTR